MATKPGKLDQMKQSGEKLKEKVSDMASNAGSNLMGLIKNLDTNKKFWIYCLANNHSSKKGIEKSNFNLIKTIRK